MRKNALSTLVLLAALSGGGAAAEGVGLAFKAGSTGLGAELTVGLGDTLNLRLGAQGFGRQERRTVSGIDYAADLSLASGNVGLDWHPGGGVFRLSGGFLIQGNKAEGTAVPRGTVTIGDTVYAANAVGTIDAALELPRTLAPFVSLGFGNGARGRRLFFGFEAGVAFSGSPAATVSASRSTPGLQQDLETEARQVEDDLRWLKTYPIVGLSVGIRF